MPLTVFGVLVSLVLALVLDCSSYNTLRLATSNCRVPCLGSVIKYRRTYTKGALGIHLT